MIFLNIFDKIFKASKSKIPFFVPELIPQKLPKVALKDQQSKIPHEFVPTLLVPGPQKLSDKFLTFPTIIAILIAIAMNKDIP